MNLQKLDVLTCVLTTAASLMVAIAKWNSSDKHAD